MCLKLRSMDLPIGVRYAHLPARSYDTGIRYQSKHWYTYVHTKKLVVLDVHPPELMENHSLKWFGPDYSHIPIDIKNIHYSLYNNPLFLSIFPISHFIFPRFLVVSRSPCSPTRQLAGSERRSPVFGALQMVQVPVTGVDQLGGEAHLFEHAINVGGPHVIRLSLQKK